MGKRIVMTAGGTREPLDDVRHVSNVASGSLPAAVANLLLSAGCEVFYIHGPGAVLPAQTQVTLDLRTNLATLQEKLQKLANQAQEQHLAVAAGTLHLLPITTAAQAHETLGSTVEDVQPDATICAMAVADYAPVRASGKVSSQLGEMSVKMTPTPKTIDIVKARCPTTVLFGFKLLSGATELQREMACTHLMQRSGADFVVCNDMADYRAGIRRGWLFDRAGLVVGTLGDSDGGLVGMAAAIASAVTDSLNRQTPTETR